MLFIMASTKDYFNMKFLAGLTGLVAFLVLMLQMAGISLVVYLGYFIYSNGLKALIDALWMGFPV